MKAAFRCDASYEIGSGHVYRCMTLADELIARGWEVFFLSAPGSEDVAPALDKPQYNLARAAIYDLRADLIVVDHYGMDAEFEGACRDWAARVAVIDDLADRRHDCDVLIDQTFGRNAADYAALVPEGRDILTGAQYAMLRPQFALGRAGALARRAAGIAGRPRVMVSLGSTNMNDVTGKVLRALRGVKRALAIDVILGAGAARAEVVRAMAAAMTREGPHEVFYHENTPDIAGLMAAADLAVGAGGTTSWERCCMGLPTLMLEIADNQKTVARNLSAAGAVRNLGRVESLSEEDIAAGVESLLGDYAALKEMGARAGEICDGRGAARAAARLYPAQKAAGGEVRLRFMEAGDSEIIFAWQSQPETRRHFRNHAPPLRAAHEAWMKGKIADMDCEAFIVEMDGRAAGLARLDKKGAGVYEVSLLVAPGEYRKGAGLAALRFLRGLRPGAELRAEILEGNGASKALFLKAGYEARGEGFYVSGKAG